MKIGFFADPHYCHTNQLLTKRFPLRSFDRIKEALEAFQKADCQVIVCLGDLIDHTPEQDRQADNDHEEALLCLS